jgi:uncharacterized DUF497 family protein
MIFEWDEEKAEDNLKKHEVSFAEGTTVFADPLSLTIPDPLHSEDDARFVITGLAHNQRQLVVVYTERGENISIISVRAATPSERKKYETGTE